MTTTAFPVRQTEDGVGCTDIAMRKINVTVTAGANDGKMSDGDSSIYSTIKLDGSINYNKPGWAGQQIQIVDLGPVD